MMVAFGGGEQRSDFFLQASSVSDEELVAQVVGISDIRDGRSDGDVRSVAYLLLVAPQFREQFFARLRHAAWRVRMCRDLSQATEAEWDGLVTMSHAVQLLLAAQMPARAIRQLLECVTHRCTCDGCDLVSGERFATIAEEMRNPRTCIEHVGGVAKTIGAGAHVESADQF